LFAAFCLVKWEKQKRSFGCVGITFAVTEALICLVFDNDITSVTLCLFVPHFKALFFCRNTLHTLSNVIAPLASHLRAECIPEELKKEAPVCK
jgi:hypothetical protein